MNHPFYRQILKKAWQIAWENKILWFFGFFAIALLGNNRAYNLIFNNLDIITRKDLTTYFTFRLYKKIFTSPHQIINFFNNLGNFIVEKPLSFFLFALIILVIIALVLFLIWLMITSQISLIRNIDRINKNKKIGFKESFKASKHFWSVLGLNFIVQIIIYFLFILFIYPTVAYTSFFSRTTTIFFLLFFLIFVPLSIIIAFLTIYTSSYIILKNQKVFEAINSAWHLFIRNWLPSLEMGLILFLIDLGVTLGLIILIILFSIPFILLSIIFYFLASKFGLILISILIIIFLVALIIFSTALLSTFQYSAWTLLFLNLTEKNVPSKIVETISSLKNYLKKSKR